MDSYSVLGKGYPQEYKRARESYRGGGLGCANNSRYKVTIISNDNSMTVYVLTCS